MTYGYSHRLVQANKKAKTSSLGVALGKLCISKNVPVFQVAAQLGVTRATIYNWFWGAVEPSPPHTERIVEYMQELERKT